MEVNVEFIAGIADLDKIYPGDVATQMHIARIIKGDPFLFNDFTPEAIASFKQPAVDAGEEVKEADKLRGLAFTAKLNEVDATLIESLRQYGISFNDYITAWGARIDALVSDGSTAINDITRLNADVTAQEEVRNIAEQARVMAETNRNAAFIAKLNEVDATLGESLRQYGLSFADYINGWEGRVTALIASGTATIDEMTRLIGSVELAEQARAAAEQKRQADTAKAIADTNAAKDAAQGVVDTYENRISPIEQEVTRISPILPHALPNATLMTDANCNGVWVPIANKEDDLAYGIKENLTLSTPDCERTANLSLHKSLPLQRKMVTAIIRPDGTLAYYLHPLHHHLKLDGTPANLDGTDGYKMTYLPDMYVKEVVVGDTKEYLFSEYPLKGYTYRPGGWMSSYEATVDRTTNTLVSVKSEDVKYRGGNNNASLDALDTTQLGMCATAISNINFLAYARKNGANWVNNDRELHETLTWLIYSEFACFNNQKAVNNELSTEGYRQGGLGAGVTTVDSVRWDAFNKYYPLVKIGASDQLGNGTGEVEYALPASFDTAEVKVKVPRYRGIENPFGHVWKWTSGILFDMGTEESKMYICNDPSKYGTGGVITSDYQFVELLPRTEGYIKEFIGGFHIQPKQVGGGAGSGTYKCDYFYTNANTSQGVRGLLLGGSSRHGSVAGCGYSYTGNAPTTTYADFGSRLCLKGGHRPTANEIDEILAKMI